MVKWFKSLTPTMQKVVAIIVAIVVWKIFQMIKSGAIRFSQNIEEQAEMASLSASGMKRTYSSVQYRQMADQLYAAMLGWGTDYNSVGAVFAKMQNDLDVMELDAKFGRREGLKWYGASAMYTMQEWLRGDLSSSNMEKYVNAPMRAKGITIQY